VSRKKAYRLRFTQLQTHYMFCNARELKLPEWKARFESGMFFEQTVNLRALTDGQLRGLRQILEKAGKQRLGGKNRTRKALRRKLRVLEEFASLSAIDRLGELRR